MKPPLDMAAHDEGANVEHVTVNARVIDLGLVALVAGFLLGFTIAMVVR